MTTEPIPGAAPLPEGTPNPLPDAGPLSSAAPLPDGSQPSNVSPIADQPRPRRRRATALLGQLGFGLSVLFVALDVVAIVLAANRSWDAATTLSQASTAGTILAFVVGAVAVILKRGRNWGMAAVVLALVANPIILTKLLAVLGGS